MGSKLPIFHTDNEDLNLLQTRWASVINPVLSSPTSGGLILKEVFLDSGDNVVNHLLGRNLVGWILIRQRTSNGGVYDTQDTNPTPSRTLQLVAATPTTVDILVF